MNVEIGAEAALFPEKEYISGIFVAVRYFYNELRKQSYTCMRQTPFYIEQKYLGIDM